MHLQLNANSFIHAWTTLARSRFCGDYSTDAGPVVDGQARMQTCLIDGECEHDQTSYQWTVSISREVVIWSI
ncbi:MAG: hypothetical protein OEU68_03515 [Nitrospira sp.]|nr:hypothetical protein [Nitrospira sp.]MDH5317125.1 hypothetical protein [Nitrospira sp.]